MLEILSQYLFFSFFSVSVLFSFFLITCNKKGKINLTYLNLRELVDKLVLEIDGLLA